MSIIKNALKKEIRENNLQQFGDTTATILEYDIISNTATIRFMNPNGEGYLLRKNVHVSNTMGGVTGSGLYSGQLCNISFIKNNVHNPIITGVMSNNYNTKTTSGQGAFLVDNTILEVKEPEEITPMIESWIEKDNENVNKYQTDLGDYTNIDSFQKANDAVRSLDKYSPRDQGITHLDTKSTIKLKENGDIDIFVDGNLGIRISPKDKSVNIHGTVKVNNKVINFDDETNTKE